MKPLSVHLSSLQQAKCSFLGNLQRMDSSAIGHFQCNSQWKLEADVQMSQSPALLIDDVLLMCKLRESIDGLKA